MKTKNFQMYLKNVGKTDSPEYPTVAEVALLKLISNFNPISALIKTA
ncbi:hypothetical protein [Maribacter sp. ACAM166]|nr:hypothetical protein [Maribacter sp. ACAM166]